LNRRITIIQGHPDSDPARYCRALADAYAEGALAGGHEVRRIDVAALDFPLLRNRIEFDAGPVPPDIARAQKDIDWAEHLLIVYPLWLGTMPALLKGFLEQAFRPGFAYRLPEESGTSVGRLSEISARVIVTMGMPALFYRWYFGAHSLKSLERNILGFAGIGPIRETLIGRVETMSARARGRWLRHMTAMGRKGA